MIEDCRVHEGRLYPLKHVLKAQLDKAVRTPTCLSYIRMNGHTRTTLSTLYKHDWKRKMFTSYPRQCFCVISSLPSPTWHHSYAIRRLQMLHQMRKQAYLILHFTNYTVAIYKAFHCCKHKLSSHGLIPKESFTRIVLVELGFKNCKENR